jgi:hypothetical protein
MRTPFQEEEIYALRSGFRRALLKETMILDRPPLIPLPGEGKKCRRANELFPLPTGGGEGVGDPIENPAPTPKSCPQWALPGGVHICACLFFYGYDYNCGQRTNSGKRTSQHAIRHFHLAIAKAASGMTAANTCHRRIFHLSGRARNPSPNSFARILSVLRYRRLPEPKSPPMFFLRIPPRVSSRVSGKAEPAPR